MVELTKIMADLPQKMIENGQRWLRMAQSNPKLPKKMAANCPKSKWLKLVTPEICGKTLGMHKIAAKTPENH